MSSEVPVKLLILAPAGLAMLWAYSNSLTGWGHLLAIMFVTDAVWLFLDWLLFEE